MQNQNLDSLRSLKRLLEQLGVELHTTNQNRLALLKQLEDSKQSASPVIADLLAPLLITYSELARGWNAVQPMLVEIEKLLRGEGSEQDFVDAFDRSSTIIDSLIFRSAEYNATKLMIETVAELSKET